MASEYAARALRYAQQVVWNELVAGKLVKAACARQLADLDRAASDDWPWIYSEAHADRVCLFIECLPHVKGRWNSVTITLEPWQCFVLCTVFGWVHRDSGVRRFRTVYIEVPRKNAKSTLTAGVALYCLAADGEFGAEVYSAATTGDQARIVFDVAKAMVKRQPRLASQFGIGAGEHAIYVPELSGMFKPLNAEGSTLDGLNVAFASVDELHAHKRRTVWDVLATATGSRAQPLLWAITTAGSDRAGICYEQRDYVCRVLQGTAIDEAYFGIIYTIDEDDDDWTDEAVWAKANPNLNVSVELDDLRAKCRFALQMPSATNNFLTKHLNIWVNADTAWMDMRKWDGCANPQLRLEEFAGQPCFEGLDLASKVDVACQALVFERAGGKIALFVRHWLPERAIEIAANSQYSGWHRAGYLQVTEGEVTDLDTIEESVIDDCRTYQVREVGFDPFQATQMSGHLLDQSLPMVEVRPTVLNFSEPMKQLEAWVLEGKLEHTGDPVLTWMVSNVVCHRDQKDNIYPRKDRPENKIDGVVALLIAINRYLAARAQPSIDNFLRAPIHA